MSFEINVCQLIQNESLSNQTCNQSSLNKFKPWVFRPKKILYGLDECPPSKKQYSTSHWNDEENHKYVEFLLKFREVLEGEKKQRRKWHINRIMSKSIGTRSHEQCRSHHQKMMKNYGNINGILKHFQAENRSTSETPQRQNQETPCPLLTNDDEQINLLNFGEESHINLPWFMEDSIHMI